MKSTVFSRSQRATRAVSPSWLIVVLTALLSLVFAPESNAQSQRETELPLQRVTLIERPAFSPFTSLRWSWSRRATTAFASVDASLAGLATPMRASELLNSEEWADFADQLAICLRDTFAQARPGILEVGGASGEGLEPGEALLVVEVGSSRSEYVIHEAHAGEAWARCRVALMASAASLSRVDAIEHPFWRPGQWGTLVVYTEPGFRVFLNGRDTGRFTPLAPIRLSPGRYEVERRSPEGAVQVDTIYVMAGQTTRLTSADSR